MIDRLVVLNDVSVARGGATAIALDSIRAVRARGVPVTLIAGDTGKNAELADLGVETVGLGQAPLLDSTRSEAFSRGLYNPLTVSKVGHWVTRHDNARTIYHVHTWTKVLSPSLFAALQPVFNRLIISAHDFFIACPNGGYVFYNSGRSCHLRPMSAACIFSNCDRRSYLHKLWRVARQTTRAMFLNLRSSPFLILAVHEGMREGLERAGIPAGAIRVLRNPVRPFSTTRVAAERNKEAFFIGRLDPEKGADLAAAAAKQANVKFRIIGDGPMLGTMLHLYPNAVYEGRKTHAEIGELIHSARALILSSRYPEPFGLVAVEAMGSGIPVVINSSALLAGEIIQRGAGVSFDPSRGESLANALGRMFSNDQETRRMSEIAFEQAHELAPSHGDWARDLMSIYEARLQTTPANG